MFQTQEVYLRVIIVTIMLNQWLVLRVKIQPLTWLIWKSMDFEGLCAKFDFYNRTPKYMIYFVLTSKNLLSNDSIYHTEFSIKNNWQVWDDTVLLGIQSRWKRLNNHMLWNQGINFSHSFIQKPLLRLLYTERVIALKGYKAWPCTSKGTWTVLEVTGRVFS